MQMHQIKELAISLKRTRPRWEDNPSDMQYARYEQWGKDVVAISNTLKRVSPRFQFTRFYTECGYLGDSSNQRTG